MTVYSAAGERERLSRDEAPLTASHRMGRSGGSVSCLPELRESRDSAPPANWPAGAPSKLRRRLAYCRPWGRRAAYLGWLGHGNLGDELLYQAFRQAFAPVEILPAIRHRTGAAVQKLLDRRLYDASFLGGGTLINTPRHTAFRELLRSYPPGIVFGAGVKDPEQWARWGQESTLPKWLPVLRDCAFVGVRGPLSAALLQEQGLKGLRVIGDPAFLFADPMPPRKEGRKVLGLNAGVSRGYVMGGEPQVLERLAAFAAQAAREGWRVRLMSVWPPDDDYLEELGRKAGLLEPAVYRAHQQPERLWSWLREVDVFVGEKLHASVMALCSGTPTVMLEYQAKCRDAMLSLGLGHYSLSTETLTPGAILDRVTDLFANLEHAQRQVAGATQERRRDLLHAAAEVRPLLRGR